MRTRSMLVKIALLLLVGALSVVADTTSYGYQRPLNDRRDAQVEVVKRIAIGDWDQTQQDLTTIDTGTLPDYWDPHIGLVFNVDPRVPTNGAEPPEQLVKVTDRKHKFPVLATICSIGFLATVITLLIVCTT